MAAFDPEPMLTQFELDQTAEPTKVCQTIIALIKLRNAVDLRIAAATQIGEEVGLPRRSGVKSMVRILIEEGLAPHIAYRALRVGRKLAELPTVADHGRAGTMSAEHVDAIVKGINHIQQRAELAPEQFDACVGALSSQALTSTPKSVSDKARALAISLAPDDAPIPVAEDRSLNQLSFSQGDDGRFTGEFDVDCATGARLMTALDPLTKPVETDEGNPDPRSAATRRAHALEEVVIAYLGGKDRPRQGGALPQLLVTMPIGLLDPAEKDDRSSLVAHLQGAGAVSKPMAEMLACDCTASRVLLDAESVPLDVGRDSRVVPTGIRKAVVARDLVCIRCGRPSSWCDVHHIRHWTHGGETSLRNLTLLCREDHSWLHREQWEVVMGEDGHPWLKPPAEAASQQLVPSFARRKVRGPGPLAA